MGKNTVVNFFTPNYINTHQLITHSPIVQLGKVRSLTPLTPLQSQTPSCGTKRSNKGQCMIFKTILHKTAIAAKLAAV